MDEIEKIDHVYEYNRMMGVETLNPLVSVVDWSQCQPLCSRRRSYGFYAVFLKDVMCGDMRYGRQYYDYQEGTLVFLAPGQVYGIENKGEKVQPKGWALVFHPDLIRGTSLGRHIDDYTFFSYEVNEALHISEQERGVVMECLHNIAAELRHSIDRHSRMLIVSNIELLLNYCLRFYDRQFITRNRENKDVIVRFERLLHDYFRSDEMVEQGLPSVRFFADKLSLSANYFGDLIKKECGKSAQEYIQSYIIETAKERLCDTSKSVSEVAYGMGFQYPQHFSRMFKKSVGAKRFLGDNATQEERNQYLIQLLEDKKQKEERRAKVITCISISLPNGESQVFKGILEGYIAQRKRGTNGFGFDEIFEIEDGRTLAELEKDEKNKLSSRKEALQKLKNYLASK